MMNFAGVTIAGAAEVPYARRLAGGSTLGLLKEVFRQALAGAGLAHRDVDGVAVASFTMKPDHAIDLAWQLGLTSRWVMEDNNGGASGINMLQHAARAIQAGDADCIAVLSADHFVAGDFKDLIENYNRTTRDHLAPLGFGGPNALFALVTQAHARAHGLSRSDYGAVCVAQRRWAQRNPRAVYRSALTMAEYLAAPMVATPLGRYDCVPVVSGADAIVLTAADRPGIARQVGIRAIAARYNSDHQEAAGWRTGLGEVAAELWQRAGAGPNEMDLFSVYDDYPVMVMAQLADLGLVPDGDFAGFMRGRFAGLAVNTSGGQLSAGQAGAAGGLHGLVEAVIQLRGEAGERQIEGARLAAVSGYGMVEYRYGMCANAVVLERL